MRELDRGFSDPGLAPDEFVQQFTASGRIREQQQKSREFHLQCVVAQRQPLAPAAEQFFGALEVVAKRAGIGGVDADSRGLAVALEGIEQAVARRRIVAACDQQQTELQVRVGVVRVQADCPAYGRFGFLGAARIGQRGGVVAPCAELSG